MALLEKLLEWASELGDESRIAMTYARALPGLSLRKRQCLRGAGNETGAHWERATKAGCVVECSKLIT